MGSLKSIALAGVVSVGASLSASAADYMTAPPPPPPPIESIGLKGSVGGGWYLRGDVGVGELKIKKYSQRDVDAAGGTYSGESKNHSVFAGAGIGYRLNSWFRLDGTFEYRGGSAISVTDSLGFQTGFGQAQLSNTYRGNVSSMVALFNAYVDLGTWNCLTPYIGAGIGYATNTFSGFTDQGVLSIAGGAGSSTLGIAGNKDNSGMAWALMAGLGYEVNKNLTLEVGYRYLNLGDAQTGIIRNAFRAESYAPLKAKDLESHDIRIGMRWNFGEPECCGPVERPVAFAPAPVVRKF